MKGWLLGLILMFFFLSPTNYFYYGVSLLLILYLFGNSRRRQWNWYVYPFVIIMFSSFLLGFSNIKDTQSLYKEAFRIFTISSFFILLPISFNKIDFHKTGLCLVITFLLVYLSQVAYLFNISFVVSFVDNYFPYEGEALGLSSEYMLQRATGSFFELEARFSGIYRNPNQCARYVILLVSAILIMPIKSIFKWAICLMAFSSILMTGSRTGLIILAIVLLAYIYYNKRTSFKSELIILILFALVIGYYLSNSDINELRVLKIESGLEGSFATKFKWFWGYLANESNALYLLLGHGTASSVSEYDVPMLDSEWGMIIFSFGFIGFILYICMIYKFIKRSPISAKIIFINFLWVFTSTVFLAYRMSIVFSIILSIVWTQSGKHHISKYKKSNKKAYINDVKNKNMAVRDRRRIYR